MHRSRSTFLASVATTALVVGLTSPFSPAVGAADAPTDRALSDIPAQAPTLPPEHRVPRTEAVTLRDTARKGAWPVRKRTAVTVADTTVPVGTPAAQRLASATIVQDLVRGSISATVRLQAAPTADEDANVVVALGRISADGRWCTSVGDAGAYWQTYGASAPGLVRDGARMELVHFPSADARKDQFDCAFAETWSYPDGRPAELETLLAGRSTAQLRPTYDKPRLTVKAPKKTPAKVNRWQKVKVKVRNGNPRVTAPGVRVKIAGKKVASKTAKLGKVRPGKQKSVKVRFRVRPGHQGRAKVVVSTKNVTKRKQIRLR